MEKANVIKKIAVELSRFIVGVTFIFSGFVKAVDPSGFDYKIQDYLISFGLEYFNFLALPIAIFLCVLEFSVGIFLVLGIYRKWTSRVALLIMAFMTPLTLYLAVANPVEDCGCFGDAWIISNWETFFKNVILLVSTILLFIYHEKIYNFYTGKFYWLIAIFTVGCGIIFSISNCYFEPVFDFRPYKIGADLPALMTSEPGKEDIYENIFIYEKDDIKQEFTEHNYPWDDTTWVFVDRISKLVQKGDNPAITDFTINLLYFNSDKSGIDDQEDITLEILEDPGYTFLMISYSLENIRENAIPRMEDIKNYANDNGYGFYCLTASTTQEIMEWERNNSVNFKYCLTDERTLKTMMRTNPGLMLLKNGVIINKWSPAYVPAEEELIKPIDELSFGKIPDMENRNRNNFWFIVIIFSVPLLLIKIMDFVIYRNRLPETVKKRVKTN